MEKEKKIVLEAMKKTGEPVNAGKVVELTGLDRKVVDKVFAELNNSRCPIKPKKMILPQRISSIQRQ